MKFSFSLSKIIRKIFPNDYESKRDKFFKYDTSFYSLINTPINTLYERCKESGLKFVKHNSKEGKLYFNYRNTLRLVTDYTVGNILEIFAKEEYKIPRELCKKKTIVFDIGMNKGFSSLYYAQSENIHKVIGFEIDPRLQQYISENIKLNKKLGEKIIVNNYGLSKKNGNIDLYVLQNDDGVTTMNKEFYNQYWGEKRREKGKLVKAQVRKASEVVLEYMKEFPDFSYLLQIDVEGAEYEIFEDLNKSEILNKFEIISGETHNGYKQLEKYLKEFKTIQYEEKPNTKLATFILQRSH